MTAYRAQPGDRSIPAAALNEAFRAAEFFKLAQDQPGQGGAVKAVNTTGGDLTRFAIVGIDAPVIDPSAQLAQFQRRIFLDAVAPAAADHHGGFGVLLDPIKDGSTGRVAVAGVTVCQVDMKHADHRFADVIDADATKLRSVGCGSARILSVASGTGTKWAVVILQARAAYSFPIEITGNSQINAGKYKYAWREVVLATDGTAGVVTGGLSGTTASGWALNRREINHTGSGVVQGVDTGGADYPDGFAPRPVDGGGDDNTHQQDVVVDAEMIGGQVWFSEAMSHDGTCEA